MTAAILVGSTDAIHIHRQCLLFLIGVSNAQIEGLIEWEVKNAATITFETLSASRLLTIVVCVDTQGRKNGEEQHDDGMR
eukprot:5117006-Ditylum_brightwellii.AAC.1